MKHRCYPKYTYIVNFVLSFFLLALAVAPFYIWANDPVLKKAMLSVVLLSLSVVTLIMALRNMQYFYFADGYLTVKWVFGVIVRLEVKNTVARTEKLTSFSNRAYLSKKTVSVIDTWICIYDKSIKNRPECMFHRGCSNSKKAKRIQIVCTEKNKELVERYIEISMGKRFKRI